MLSRIHQP